MHVAPIHMVWQCPAEDYGKWTSCVATWVPVIRESNSLYFILWSNFLKVVKHVEGAGRLPLCSCLDMIWSD